MHEVSCTIPLSEPKSVKCIFIGSMRGASLEVMVAEQAIDLCK
jgi:hypothetical protein